MRLILLTQIIAYVVGFLFVFVAEAAVGPVTLPLAFVRAVVWPLYVTTGIPQGQRARMD